MKFACPKCSTRYSIADEKVPAAKTLRFPCKKCGNVIRLQRKKTAAKKKVKAVEPVKQKAPVKGPTGLENASTRVAPLDELEALRSEAAGITSGDITAPHQEDVTAKYDAGDTAAAATKVASVADIQEALAAAESAPIAPDERGAAEEWYILIAGKQKGPMTALRIVDMLSRNEIDKRSYVWREGMGDWKRLGSVSEFKDLAQRVGDAAWRVMAPLDEPTGVESTVAMNARELQEQLQRVRDSAANRAEPSGFEDEDTRQMDVSGAQKALAEAGIITSPGASIDDIDRSTEISPPVDLRDPAVIDALSGEPTGDRLTRPISGEQSQELIGTMFPDNEAANADDLFPAPREPEPFSEDDVFTPASGELAVTGDNSLGFDDTGSRDLLSEAGGFPDATEEPVGAPISDPSDYFEEEGVPPSSEYKDAPPGESTRLFMATAGLYKRRRMHRLAATGAFLVIVSAITIISLDIMKVVELPGMGTIYAKTGLLDPNPTRGIRKVESELAKADLTAEQRASLVENRKKYEKLLLTGDNDDDASSGGGGGGGGGRKKRKGVNRDGVKDTRDLDDNERDTLKDVFGDDRKSEDAIRLADPDHIETPNLPDGLSRDVIFDVFKENARSIQLCFSESTRKGEQLAGKMEMEVTIAPDGGVTDVAIVTDHFKRTAMGACTIRRVKSWRFPKFNGKPVTVVLPYIVAPVI